MLDYHYDRFDILVPLSGGIDSTAALYNSLSENPDANHLVYRVQLINGTSGHRTIREAMAAEKIVHWLESKGFKNFAFRELTFDYSSLGMMPPIWDSDAINFVAAVVVQARPELNVFVDGAIADDYLDPGFQKRLDKISSIFYTASERTPENFEMRFPLKSMNKYDVIKSLPTELLRLCWSCRYPEIGPPYTFVRCHKCPQCKVLDDVLITHPEEFRNVSWLVD